MPRFVVLRHECPPDYARPSHWDFLLEAGSALRTWALLEPPVGSCEQPAEALPDHRPEYLSYEGGVSGGRGSVTRWDEGTFEPLELPGDANPADVHVRLSGRRLNGDVWLQTVDAARWTYRFTPRT